jgi:putative acetyltransferase
MVPVRPATDDDAAGVIDLIARVFSEYPGCVLDVDREEPELRAPASSFDRFWVVEERGKVVGCIACALHGEVVELKKLYVDAAARGRGFARQLVNLVEATARDHGAKLIEFWSDTRFTTAHAVYEHFGYAPTGRTRDLHDLSHTTEYHYTKHLRD